MTEIAKFAFETSFAPADLAAEEAARIQAEAAATYDEEEMAAIRERAHAEGMAAGIAQTRDSIEQAAVKALEGLRLQIGDLGLTHEKAMSDTRRDATELALLIARKLAPALIEREPLSEIEALIGECLAGLCDEPRVVIRTTEPISAALRNRVDRLASDSGFPGQIVLLADDAMADTDCRVEWADGGAERDRAALDRRIEDALQRYMRREQERRDLIRGTDEERAAAGDIGDAPADEAADAPAGPEAAADGDPVAVAHDETANPPDDADVGAETIEPAQ